MDFFDYRGDALYAEDVPVADLSAEFGTHSISTRKRHYCDICTHTLMR
jgi:hypothetical protein